MQQELTTNREAEILEECQKAIGYQFRQPDLLRAALTHASGANTRLASNERLEFLGDAVLGLVTCEQLFLRFPDYQEGDLTKIKSVVVSRRTCARISRLLQPGRLPLPRQGHERPHRTCRPACWPTSTNRWWRPSISTAAWRRPGRSSSSTSVPEIEQVAEGRPRRQLQVAVAAGGPARVRRHAAVSSCSTRRAPTTASASRSPPSIGRHAYAAAWGRNKKEAEQKAAMNALAQINGEPVPFEGD